MGATTELRDMLDAYGIEVTVHRPTTKAELARENAKLRELVSWMYDRMDESCAVQHPYAPAPIRYDQLMQALGRARELGVEVD